MSTNNPNATITTTPTTATGDNGHMAAWRAQKAKGDFAPTLTVAMATMAPTANPWRVNCPGWHFYNAVLSKLPGDATVATVMAMAKEAGIKGAMGHLIWLYPWLNRGNRLIIGGCQYPEQPIPAATPTVAASTPTPVKAKAPTPAKAPAKAKAKVA